MGSFCEWHLLTVVPCGGLFRISHWGLFWICLAQFLAAVHAGFYSGPQQLGLPGCWGPLNSTSPPPSGWLRSSDTSEQSSLLEGEAGLIAASLSSVIKRPATGAHAPSQSSPPHLIISSTNIEHSGMRR